MRCQSIVGHICLLFALTSAHLAPIHYTIARRGGGLAITDTANLSVLLDHLQDIESRFSATTRQLEKNTVVRKAKRRYDTEAGSALLGEVGRVGNWFATIELGEPAQHVRMDLDMLTADWWVQSTNSDLGSFFLDFNSKTYRDSERPLSFPTCRYPTDILHLNTIDRLIPINFAHCRPAQQWLRSLGPSGAYLGLAASSSLSQLNTTSLMNQLIEKNIIDLPMWSVVLLNGQDGLFSMGGTPIATIREIERETRELLSGQDTHSELKRGTSLEKRIAEYTPTKEGDPSTNWKWLKVQGSDGWWQIQLHGIWVDGRKIVFNQPAVLDVNTPFILAPPMAARALYASVPGSRRSSPPHDQFHTYPCMSPPQIHFDFSDWTVEVFKGRRISSPGGRFSLGRLAPGSGYCVGSIVESRMDIEKSRSKFVHDNGLGNAWIIGEPFFKDVQVAFEWKTKRVGLRRV